jgi:PAS domain S-box-containing protein
MVLIKRRKRYISVSVKLLFVLTAIILLVIGVKTVLDISLAKKHNRVHTQEGLYNLYDSFYEEVKILERNAAALSLSFARRHDLQKLFYSSDREGMLDLLGPLFTDLKTNYNIVHLQFHDPKGTIFLRIHDPQRYGDYTFLYRRANAKAIITRQTVFGVEVDPNRLGIQGITPIFHAGQFIGLVEVGLDFDQAFIENLKSRNGVDYTMWIAKSEAIPAGLGPVEGAPQPPFSELFLYAGTKDQLLPVEAGVYERVLNENKPQIQFISHGQEELAVLVAPLLGYDDRVIGILEISVSRMEALSNLRKDQIKTLIIAGGLSLFGLALMWMLIDLTVLRPVRHLTAVTRRHLDGDLQAQVKLMPRDEFGLLGNTFNILRNKLNNIIRTREETIAERTDELKKINMKLKNDIKKRQQVEKALRESEEKYRSVVENANEAIFIAQDEVVKFPNPISLRMTGYSEEELRKIPFVKLIHPEDREIVLDRHKKRLKGEEPPSTYSFRILNKKGEELWVQLNTVLITWEGRPATINFLRDLTIQKRLEAQFQAAQRMESLGTLAGGIAHDFNNLLMGIQGHTSLMLVKSKLNDYQHEHLKGIEEHVTSAADLTKQLLGIVRGGKYEVKPSDLNEIIKKTVDMFGRTKKEIVIRTIYQKDIWICEVDRGQFEQVLFNLYVNAWQAMQGGGELKIKTENVVLEDYYVKPYKVEPGRYVKVSVKDTGVGMSESVQQRIFDPFFTTKEMGRGTGLGLAAAYGIVKSHGGIINVNSKKGKGSTFHIFLPVSEKEVEKDKELKKCVENGTGNVLLIDDEEMIIDVGRKMIETLGYNVITANNGKDAIDVYKNCGNDIDIVILDMIMPDMGGKETYSYLKKINPDLKVLLSSGYSIDGQAEKIMEQGCNGFIQKPFSLTDLSQKLKEL